jgi:hypothetical protein
MARLCIIGSNFSRKIYFYLIEIKQQNYFIVCLQETVNLKIEKWAKLARVKTLKDDYANWN